MKNNRRGYRGRKSYGRKGYGRRKVSRTYYMSRGGIRL